MQGSLIHFGFKVDGTLTADNVRRFQAPVDLQLVKVNAGADNATSFILDIGTAADTDAYLDGVTVTGATSTTTDFGQTDFVDDEFPAIPDGTEVVITIDYDGGAGTDGAGVHVDLWFTY